MDMQVNLIIGITEASKTSMMIMAGLVMFIIIQSRTHSQNTMKIIAIEMIKKTKDGIITNQNIKKKNQERDLEVEAMIRITEKAEKAKDSRVIIKIIIRNKYVPNN